MLFNGKDLSGWTNIGQEKWEIENGTLHNQKQRVATLGTLRGDAFAGPALIVIGEVVRFARSAAAESSAKAA